MDSGYESCLHLLTAFISFKTTSNVECLQQRPYISTARYLNRKPATYADYNHAFKTFTNWRQCFFFAMTKLRHKLVSLVNRKAQWSLYELWPYRNVIWSSIRGKTDYEILIFIINFLEKGKWNKMYHFYSNWQNLWWTTNPAFSLAIDDTHEISLA